MNTPGFGGYLLAWQVSVLALTAALSPMLFSPPLVEEWGPDDVFLTVWLVELCSVPFACVGVPLVHFLCRDVSAQWLHVLAAGVVGWLALAVPVVLGGSSSGMNEPLEVMAGPLLLGACAACGRLAVIPFVWRRRRDSAGPARRC